MPANLAILFPSRQRLVSALSGAFAGIKLYGATLTHYVNTSATQTASNAPRGAAIRYTAIRQIKDTKLVIEERIGSTTTHLKYTKKTQKLVSVTHTVSTHTSKSACSRPAEGGGVVS